MNERIERMADNVTDSVIRPSRISAVGEDEDVALSNVDQALDKILAALLVIDENLPAIKTASVPEKAAVDAIKDLMETAIHPYFADVLKAMQVF